MAYDDVFVLLLVVPLVFLIGGFVLMAMGLHRRGRLKELAYRERLAMIEKGLTPPPESDPEEFERLLDPRVPVDAMTTRGLRSRNAGVLLIGLGMALTLLIGFAGNAPGPAVGVGGSIAVVGGAFLVIGLWNLRQKSYRPPQLVRRDKPATNSSSSIGPEAG